MVDGMGHGQDAGAQGASGDRLLDGAADPGSLRADVVVTESPQVRSGRIVVNAPPELVFEVLADPTQHSLIDGSGMVRSNVSGPVRLSLGAKFGMSMHFLVPYSIRNTVMEFEEGELIAWRHFNGHRWRYELRPVLDVNGTTVVATEVTESFDGRYARVPCMLGLIRAYDGNQVAILKTLVRLKALVESRVRSGDTAGSAD